MSTVIGMRIVSKEEFFLSQDELCSAIKKGAVFIYPTDTIYGIGCNALLEEAVQKVREAKERAVNPFSVIAPSKAWIFENCEVPKQAEKWLDKLPGPYTIILTLKKKRRIAPAVNSDAQTIGVRIPQHWVSDVVAELGIPIVTTSVNKAGSDFVTSLEQVDDGIRQYVAFAVDEGMLHGKPSTLIHAYKENIEIVERR